MPFLCLLTIRVLQSLCSSRHRKPFQVFCIKCLVHILLYHNYSCHVFFESQDRFFFELVWPGKLTMRGASSSKCMITRIIVTRGTTCLRQNPRGNYVLVWRIRLAVTPGHSRDQRGSHTTTRLASVCVNLNSKSEAQLRERAVDFSVRQGVVFSRSTYKHTHKHTNHPRCLCASECSQEWHPWITCKHSW